MAHRVSRMPEVRRDLVELADHISGDNLDAALRFLDAAERTFRFVAVNREVGQLCQFAHAESAGFAPGRLTAFATILCFTARWTMASRSCGCCTVRGTLRHSSDDFSGEVAKASGRR